MLDDNWELINGEDAHHIEVLNKSSQINVIEALVRLLLHTGGAGEGQPCPRYPSEQALRELHRVGTLFLLANPGEYRTTDVNLQDKNGNVAYEPPGNEHVAELMTGFLGELGGLWTQHPVVVASYALWKINWIHPFKNGNGRTARAFAYACLCLRFGFILPGAPTVLDLIMDNKPEFEAALREADQTFARSGAPDLARMNAFVERLLIQQLSSV